MTPTIHSLLFAPFVVLAAIFRLSRNAEKPPFKPKPLLNEAENALFGELCRVANRLWPDMHVCPQVAYGEFLACKDTQKRNAISRKRADFVLARRGVEVCLVVECQGKSNWARSLKPSQNAQRKDAAKRQALAEAGIPLLELEPGLQGAVLSRAISGAMGEGGQRRIAA